MTINWDNLRTYNNSLNSAFEELCCQLARYEQVPEGAKFIRKGTPDAGVECFWILPNEDEMVWQAKYFRASPDDGQWRQIDNSVKTALERHPNLISYTLCFPIDRPDARIEGRQTCLERWFEYVEKWEGWALEREMSVKFHFWGSSEIVDRLSRDEHRGRIFFWFNRDLFNNNWYREKVEEKIKVVGVRYTPELNIELPISQIFDGLGRTLRFFSKIKGFYAKINRAYQKTKAINRLEVIEKYRETLEEIIISLLTILKNIELIEVEQIEWDNIIIISSKVEDIIENILNILYEEYDKSQNSDQHGILYLNISNNIYHFRELYQYIYEIREFANSIEAKLSNIPVLLLVGDAGTGKTHLFCDIAQQRVNSNLPTILLLGQHFIDGEPWRQILDTLSLSCNRDEFLCALEASAQAEGKKALIIIDALNEGEGKTLWRKYIESILLTVSRFKWISITFSLRSSYEATIIPDSLTSDNLIKYVHKGFGGVEFEAVKLFFTYYRITLPSVPLLFPEFRNPLFLKIFCQGLNNLQLTNIPPDIKSITNVFDLFIKSINKKLSHQEYLDYNYRINYVDNAINLLAKLMSEKKIRWLKTEEAQNVVNSLLPREGYEKSLFRHMISEGILAEDIFRAEESELIDGIHFVYERFSDYIIAKNLLNDHLNKEDHLQSFSIGSILSDFFKDEWSCHINRGLIEAFAIQLPELIGAELIDLIPYAKKFEAVIDAFIDSLIWRNPETIGETTDKIIKELVNGYKQPLYRFLEVVLTVASNPIHPYNANYLHDILKRYSLADRDAWWSIFLHDQYDSNSSIDRLIEWAWSYGGKVKIDDEPILLSGIALSWFLTTSNRFLRDRTTKALVALFSQRIHLLIPLIRSFIDINDYYVLERIFAVAYGSCLRSSDEKNICDLAITVYNLVFESGYPTPHILLRDYARGVIETALHIDSSLRIELDKIKPPYNSKWIASAPSREDLDKLVERDPSIPYEKVPTSERSKYMIYNSVMSYGDFARYIIGTNSYSFKWSNIPIKITDVEYDHEKHRFDLSFIQRWIFHKVFELGWTSELFGEFDYFIDRIYNKGRSAHKVERIGKKYQWLAFHEILARISDNFRYVGDFWEGGEQKYDGPWQMFYRNIDPSFLLTKTESQTWVNNEAKWWAPETYNDWESEPDDTNWIQKSDDLPDIQSLLEVSSPKNREHWFVLQAFYRYEQPIPIEEDRYEIPQRVFHYHIMGHIVRKSELAEFVEWVNTELSWDQAYSRLGQFYNVFMGELFRFPAYFYKTRIEQEYNDWSIEYPNCLIKVVIPCNIYEWESVTFDCSIDEHISIYIPSKWLAENMELLWNGIEGQFTDKDGNLITFDTSVFLPGPGAFLVNKDHFSKFLEDNELGICWIVQGQKRIDSPLWRVGERQESLKIKAVFYLENGEIIRLPPNISFDSE